MFLVFLVLLVDVLSVLGVVSALVTGTSNVLKCHILLLSSQPVPYTLPLR